MRQRLSMSCGARGSRTMGAGPLNGLGAAGQFWRIPLCGMGESRNETGVRRWRELPLLACRLANRDSLKISTRLFAIFFLLAKMSVDICSNMEKMADLQGINYLCAYPHLGHGSAIFCPARLYFTGGG
jgi:hypothetical protein